MVTEDIKKVLRGGEFLVKETEANNIFTPEDINEEQEAFRDMAREFVQKKVWPNVEKIDKGDHDLVVKLLDEAGEMGLLGSSLPEEYNGLAVNFNTESFLSEELGASHSWGVAVAAHTGIGTLPILYFGTEEQKAKYLPGLATGELKAAYCLTEPGSGSDALAAKTKATLVDDGANYLIEGQKMWITNSGFADVFIVFAQVDGDKFTGFIIPADAENVNLGAEEDKLGIKGSSTRQVFFEGVKVPADYVLGEIGKGHRIAFNVLNIGRYKLCAMVLGGAKRAADVAVKYANERQQFKTSIANFGAIKYKIAEMATQIYAAESSCYRTSGLIQDKIALLVEEKGITKTEAKLEAAEEYSIECAMLKVIGSEVLDYVVDEAVQIHGGNGFSEEYPAARAYRDARINRIFEGTNEINRLLTVGMILKRAMKGQVDMFGPAMEVQKELTSFGSMGELPEGLFGSEKAVLANMKKAILMTAGAAAQKYMQALEKEQMLMTWIADMLNELYNCESTLLRTEKLIAAKGEEAASHEIAMTKLYFANSVDRVNTAGKNAICSFAEGEELRVMLMGLKRFTKNDPVNTVALRRTIADKLIGLNGFTY
ncbi:UNVERIFIED_CONTAM: hypothetical protein GTU68_003719 [Idotea baltica]|nr:hypothetical protein [Idotea baltica]